jgi:excisionase family DNA binding protein
MATITSDYLTVKEVADSLRLSVQAVYDSIARGTLVAKKFGRAIRIHRDALAAYEDAADAGPKAKVRKSPLPAPGRRRVSAPADLMRPISERGD